MRALVLCPDAPPEPHTRTGGFARLGLFLRALARVGAATEVMHLCPPANLPGEANAAFVDAQRRYWSLDLAAVHVTPTRARPPATLLSRYLAPIASAMNHPFFGVYAGPAQAGAVQAMLRAGGKDRFDLVVVQRLAAMMPLLRATLRPRRVLFDLDDVEHRARWRALAAPPFWPGKVAEAVSLAAVHGAERRSAALAQFTTVCSEPDRRYLSRIGLRRLRVVPNAVAAPRSAPPLPPGQTMLFVGSYGHAPNIDAVGWLAQEIWPRVAARLPEARLLVAGSPAEVPRRVFAGAAGVEVTGFVPDIGALYERARLVVCPLRLGGGTRVKLVEAAAYGRATVSTTVGAEGLSLRPGHEVEIADDAEGFADACVRLLLDDARCAAQAAAARRWVAQNADAGASEAAIAGLLQEMAGS